MRRERVGSVERDGLCPTSIFRQVMHPCSSKADLQGGCQHKQPSAGPECVKETNQSFGPAVATGRVRACGSDTQSLCFRRAWTRGLPGTALK